MSGERSFGGVYATDRLQMIADRPVSALQTLFVRNNVQHLVDVACQTRFNWVATTSSSEYGAGGEAGERSSMGCMFPTTITSENKLPSLDIRVAARHTGSPTDALITISVRAWTPPGSTTSPNILALSHVASTSTATWYDSDFVINREWKHWSAPIAYSEDLDDINVAATAPPSLVLLKVEVYTSVADAGAGNLHIVGLNVREYLT